jgi:hypothetical protein
MPVEPLPAIDWKANIADFVHDLIMPSAQPPLSQGPEHKARGNYRISARVAGCCPRYTMTGTALSILSVRCRAQRRAFRAAHEMPFGSGVTSTILGRIDNCLVRLFVLDVRQLARCSVIPSAIFCVFNCLTGR